MAENLCRFLSTQLLLIIAVMNFAAHTKQDDAALLDPTPYSSSQPADECSYPCIPQPVTATSNCPPPPPSPPMPTAFPPPPPGGWVYYQPPSGYFSPPSGYFPYNPPPWYSATAPPPPDPILPYFPFYYKQPPPPSKFSSSTRLVRSMVWISSLISLLLLS